MENPFETIARRLSNIEDLLLDLKHRPTNSVTLNVEPNGSFSWLRSVFPDVPENTLRQWDAAGKIPGSSKFGKRRIYHKQTVLDWQKSRASQPVDFALINQRADEQITRQLSNKGGVRL